MGNRLSLKTCAATINLTIQLSNRSCMSPFPATSPYCLSCCGSQWHMPRSLCQLLIVKYALKPYKAYIFGRQPCMSNRYIDHHNVDIDSCKSYVYILRFTTNQSVAIRFTLDHHHCRWFKFELALHSVASFSGRIWKNLYPFKTYYVNLKTKRFFIIF